MKMKLLPVATRTPVEILPVVDSRALIEAKSQIITGREDMDDSFYICDLGDIVKKHQRWLKEFPRIHPHYAIKCNPDPIMLKMLLALGTGFDCASKSEICQMLSLGARPDQIIFANPCKQTSHVKYSRDNDVKLTVFDNEEELVKMKKHYPNANLVLRIQTDDSAAVCRFSMKFGAPIESCKQLIDKARSMDLNVVGISFHVGSGCQDAGAFVLALQNARMLFDYAETVGYKFNLLDIGGGFPGTENVDLKFEEITSVVNQQLEVLFPVEDYSHVRIIAEPGRYYAASAFTLATNVIAKRSVARDLPGNEEKEKQGGVFNAVVPSKCDEPAFMYYINDGLYGSFNCLFFDHAEVTPTLLKKPPVDSMKFSSSIWGPTCDGLDRVMEHCLLAEIEVGDWIIWHEMGAYTISAASTFNGFVIKKVHYVISEEEHAILRKLSGNTKMEDVWFICGNNNLQEVDLYEKAELKKNLLEEGDCGALVPDAEAISSLS